MMSVRDEGLSNIEIEPVTSITGGTITGTNGAPLVRQLSGERTGNVPVTSLILSTISPAPRRPMQSEKIDKDYTGSSLIRVRERNGEYRIGYWF